MAVPGRIAVMRTGEIAQCDRPEVLYDRPATPFVVSFIGGFSLLEGRSVRDAFHFGQQTVHSPVSDGPAALVVRPEDARPAESHPEIRLQGRVQSAAFQGRCWRFVVEVEGQMVRLDWPTSAEVGSAFGFSLPPDRCRLLPLKSNPKQSKPET